MQYSFHNNPEFHVWDQDSYDSIDINALYQNSWMARYLKQGDKILDLGCGPGYGVKVLERHGYEVLGVDLNHELVTRARAHGLNVIEKDAVDAVREMGEHYDFFCMSDFVEHIPLEVVFAICSEVSKLPAKKLFLCTPNLDSMMGFKFWFHMPTHVNAMHPYVIRQMLEKMNYKIIEEWSEYGNLPGRGWKLKIRCWILDKLFGPTQARLFHGGANICFVAESKS